MMVLIPIKSEFHKLRLQKNKGITNQMANRIESINNGKKSSSDSR